MYLFFFEKMNLIKLKDFLSKKNFYYIIFFILTIYIYDGFTNIYIILKDKYDDNVMASISEISSLEEEE